MEDTHQGDVNQNMDELQVDVVQPEVRVVVSRDLTSSPPADDQQQQPAAAVPVVPDVPVAPDGGWGWAVLFAAFFVSLIVDGICYTFGVIKPELMDTFDASSSATAWAGSLCAGCYLLVGKSCHSTRRRWHLIHLSFSWLNVCLQAPAAVDNR